MIYVTVGSHYQSFDRLVKKIDDLTAQIDEEVVMQIGYSTYLPRKAAYFDFCSLEKAEGLIQKAALVVSHAGIGTIISARQFKKPMVIVPRLKEYHEHNNDHQLEIAEALKTRPWVRVVEDLDLLEESMRELKDKPLTEGAREAGKRGVIDVIKQFLEGVEGGTS